jgi:hypothetical protein
MVSASSPEDEESPEGDEPSFLGLDKWCIVARESWEQKRERTGGTRRITGGGLGRGPVRVVPNE